ncbi:GAF domain-containing protein [Amycolatopsis stemonae]
MSTPTDHFGDAVTEITALLAAHHDGLTVLRAVTQAYGTALEATATGVLVTDPRGGVSVLSASDETVRFIEVLQAQAGEGSCVDCVEDNSIVRSADLARERRWPKFVATATAAGFRAVYAFPMSLVDQAVGGLNVFYDRPVDLSVWRLRQGQALADLATLGLTQERDQRRLARLAEHTLTTLNDRVHIGQAVGVVAASLDIAPDVARARLFAYSTHSGRSLREVAQAVTDQALDLQSALGA